MADAGHASSLAGQIQEEADALVAGLEQVATKATHLAGLLNQANAGLATFEQYAANICRGAVDHLDELSGRLNAKLGEATSEAHTFDGVLHQAADPIRGDWQLVETAGHALATADEHAIDALTALGHVAEAADAELSNGGQALIAIAGKEEEALRSTVATSKASLEDVLAHIRQLGDHWLEFAEQMADVWQQDLTGLAQSLETHIGQELAGAVTTMGQVVEQIGKDGIVAPVGQIAEELIHTVTEELTALADQAIDKLDQKIREIIDDILHSKDHGDQIEQDMRAAFDELKPIFDEVEQLSHVVRDIAGIVGAGF